MRINRLLLAAGLSVFLGVRSLMGQEIQTFRGQIADTRCSGKGQPVAVNDSAIAAPHCSTHVRRGARYVLWDSVHKSVYQLDNQKKAKAFAGRDVLVIGSVNRSSGKIHIAMVIRALPPKVSGAKSVYILCDACPRGMAKAKLAAFTALNTWGRFQVITDRHKADLIFLFSANPYLGDYLTRDGPDTRPTYVDITYMDVVDPTTGESLWNDHKQWGSYLVSKATRDLIEEFKEQLATQEGEVAKLGK